MCERGVCRTVSIGQRVTVDACIADEIVALNRQGVYTVGSCCGHGRDEATAVILPSCAARARDLGYTVNAGEGGEYPGIVLRTGATPTPARSEAAGGEGDADNPYALIDRVRFAPDARAFEAARSALIGAIARQTASLRQQLAAAREDGARLSHELVDAEDRARDLGSHVARLLTSNHALRDVLDDAIEAVRGARKGSIGSIDSHYLPQIRVERVEQWRDAARSEPSGEGETCGTMPPVRVTPIRRGKPMPYDVPDDEPSAEGGQ